MRGLALVGDAVTGFLRYVLGVFGLQVPDYAIRIGTILLVILVLWKYSNLMSKIVLYALVFLLLSEAAGLLRL
ncbi:MAG: hypothetical protein ACP5PQ_07470 [Thermoproteota archaeon]